MSNEYDISKKMIDQIRGWNNVNKTINESEESIIDLTGDELKGQKKEFTDMVTARCEYGPFKIYPEANNATFSGKINDNLEWQFSLKDGIYINAPNIELNDDVVEVVKKMNAYFVSWRDTWQEKLNNEYTQGYDGNI